MDREKRIQEMPTQEELEWFLSGTSGGRDGRGVAVRYDLIEQRLVPDHNFSVRRVAWWGLNPGGQDSYSLTEMPSRALIEAYLNHRAFFNVGTHRLELDREVN